MTVDWVDVDKDCANSSLYLTTYVNDIFEHYRRREVGVLMFLSTVSVTLPYLTFGVTVIMLATVSAEALLSYGPMSFPVHRALAWIFNHRSIALGFSDFHLWCALLKPRTHTLSLLDSSGRLSRPQTHIPLLQTHPGNCPTLGMMSTANTIEGNRLISPRAQHHTGSQHLPSTQPGRWPSIALISMLSLSSVDQIQEASLTAVWSLTWPAQARQTLCWLTCSTMYATSILCHTWPDTLPG